jgi:alpha-ketoglutarate-dependent taurine dioxygenase
MAIAIKNLDATLGAEVVDIDLSKPLPPADIGAIEAAWRERLVHGQTLSDPQLITFSRNFGETRTMIS